MGKTWGDNARAANNRAKDSGWGKPGSGGDSVGSRARGQHAKPGRRSAWGPVGHAPKQTFWGWLWGSKNVSRDVKGAVKPPKGDHARGKPGGEGKKPDKLDAAMLPKWMLK